MACENVLASQEVVRLRCARGGLVAALPRVSSVALRARWFGFTVRLNGAERHRLERSAEPAGGPPGGGIKAERDVTPTCRGRRAFKT